VRAGSFICADAPAERIWPLNIISVRAYMTKKPLNISGVVAAKDFPFAANAVRSGPVESGENEKECDALCTAGEKRALGSADERTTSEQTKSTRSRPSVLIFPGRALLKYTLGDAGD